MASGVYGAFKQGILSGGASAPIVEEDTIKVALYDTNHVFTATDYSYTATHEITGTGYTAGGNILSGSYIGSADGITFYWTAANSSWSSATFTAYHAVLYDYSRSPTILICSIDFGGAQAVAAGTFTIQWNAQGIISLA